jgi:hypothetical protein
MKRQTELRIEFHKNIENTAKELDAIEKEKKDAYYNILKDNELKNAQELSEVYHRAKEKSSNPELVKSVENLLGKETTPVVEEVKPTEVKENLLKNIEEVDIENHKLNLGNGLSLEVPKISQNVRPVSDFLIKKDGKTIGSMHIANAKGFYNKFDIVKGINENDVIIDNGTSKGIEIFSKIDKRKGYGTKAYIGLLKILNSELIGNLKGGRVLSSPQWSQSIDSYKLWEGLYKKGLAKIIGTTAEGVENIKDLTSESDKKYLQLNGDKRQIFIGEDLGMAYDKKPNGIIYNGNIYALDLKSIKKTLGESELAKPKEEIKPTEVEQLKTKENAIQEPSTSSVLQYPQEGARETGGERGRVEPSKQGEAIAEKGKQVEGNEEEVKPKEYTSKTGRQKIVYDEKGNSKVIDTKTGKEVSRETAKKVFNEAADNFDFSKGKKASFEGADLKDEREVENYTIENSSNPTEIAEVYARQELEPPVLNSAETAIVNHGIGKVSVKSFKEVNDANNITFGLAKNWFQKGGKGADLGAKAEEISDKMGVPVSAEDIANFMIRFPSGARAEKLIENQTAYNAREKFEKLTGLPLTEEIAHKAIDYEFNKLTKEQQAIAEQDFKTRKQLEDAYWAEQPGAVKPAPEKGDNIAAKQAAKAEKGLKEPIVEKKPLEGIQKEYQEVINKTGERVREKAKLEFVERNFDSILNKLKEKIKEKCPT